MVDPTDPEDAADVCLLIERHLSRYGYGDVSDEIATVRRLAEQAAASNDVAWQLLFPMWTLALMLDGSGGGGEEVENAPDNVVVFRRKAA